MSKSGKVREGTFPEQTWLTQCCCPQSVQLDGALQPSMSLAAGDHEVHPNDFLWPLRPSTPCSSPHTCICLAGAGIQQQWRCAEHQRHGKAQGNGESRSRLGWVLAYIPHFRCCPQPCICKAHRGADLLSSTLFTQLKQKRNSYCSPLNLARIPQTWVLECNECHIRNGCSHMP